MSHFKKISGIDVENDLTWRGANFITVDIDWCHDDILLNAIDLLEKAKVSATWFVTHDTYLLERLSSNPRFDLGIHPNFNNLLIGDNRNGRDAEEVVDRILEIVPAAKSVRSHSLTCNSRLLDLFYNKNLSHECNLYLPQSAKPFLWRDKMVRVAHFWEDDLEIASGNLNRKVREVSLLKVYDFHPIHIFLNSHTLDLYESTRSTHHDPRQLISFRNRKFGVCDYLERLLDLK